MLATVFAVRLMLRNTVTIKPASPTSAVSSAASSASEPLLDRSKKAITLSNLGASAQRCYPFIGRKTMGYLLKYYGLANTGTYVIRFYFKGH